MIIEITTQTKKESSYDFSVQGKAGTLKRFITIIEDIEKLKKINE